MFKSGFVAIIGRPNVGKSTLLNKILGRKISITSSKVQTTRNNIRGILTTDDSQIVFIDTPGIHKPKNSFGELMNTSAWDSTKDCEVILLLTESNTELGTGDKMILEYASKKKTPLFVVISKCDIASKEEIANKIRSIQEYEGIEEVVPISAETGTNIELLVKLINDKLPQGPQFFDSETIVDQNSEFIIGELIREQVLHKTQQEIPHGAAAMVEKMNYDRKKDLWIINGVIFVNRESHKRIVVGRAGSMISKISKDARGQIKYFLKKDVYLKLFVKVKEKWQTGNEIIKIYGYGE